MTRLRFGVLGAARISPTALFRPARAVDDVEVVAIAARDRTRAMQTAGKWGIARVHDTYQQVVEDPDVDAVYVPLPNGLHAQWTLAAIAAGKHVLCEKPFTSNAAQAVRGRGGGNRKAAAGRDGGVPLPVPPADGPRAGPASATAPSVR